MGLRALAVMYRPRASSLRFGLLLVGVLLQACRAFPTPGQIARCHTDAGVTLPKGPKVRSIYLEPEAVDLWGCRDACYSLLRDRDLQFVEVPREGFSGLTIDRVSLDLAGSSRCASPFQNRPHNYQPLRYRFWKSRGECLVIQENQTRTAEATLRERRVPNSDFPATVREVIRPDGTVLAQTVDYRANYVEAPIVTCANVIPGFPLETYKIILAHVTEHRRG
jgi:hypothetical protein